MLLLQLMLVVVLLLLLLLLLFVFHVAQPKLNVHSEILVPFKFKSHNFFYYIQYLIIIYEEIYCASKNL